jgi:integrase/recombinase XerD
MVARKLTESDIIGKFYGYLCRVSSENTASSYTSDVKAFMQTIDYELDAFTEASAEDFIAGVESDGSITKLSASTQNRRLASLKAFVKWLNRDGRLIDSPLTRITRIKPKKVLPVCLTEEECVALMEAADKPTPVGIRDRAILELLYSGGCRVDEVLKLTTQSVDMDKEVVKVNGKGSKERLVILGKQAKYWIAAYLEHARPSLARDISENILFVARNGKAMTRNNVWHMMQVVAKRPGLKNTYTRIYCGIRLQPTC